MNLLDKELNKATLAEPKSTRFKRIIFLLCLPKWK